MLGHSECFQPPQLSRGLSRQLSRGVSNYATLEEERDAMARAEATSDPEMLLVRTGGRHCMSLGARDRKGEPVVAVE